MATTGSGVVFTPIYGATSDGGGCRWLMRDDNKGATGPVPSLMFVHGGGGTVESFGNPGWTTLRDSLIDAGWAIVEGDGGGPQNWGTPSAQALYVEMADWLDSQINVGTFVIFGHSMGGIATYNLGAQGPLAGRHSSVIILNGTADLIYRYNDESRSGAGLGIPWGIGGTYDLAAFKAVADPYDPMQFPHSVWAGKRVLQAWGAQDTSVQPGPHGQAWVDKYGTSTLETTVHVSDPGGHEPTHSGMVFMFQYMQGLLASPPLPAPTGVYEFVSVDVIR